MDLPLNPVSPRGTTERAEPILMPRSPFRLGYYLLFGEVYRSPYRRVIGAAGVLGALGGAFLAGQAMIAVGWFRPGVTPNAEILAYWPGFLTGALIVGFTASGLARVLFAMLPGDDEE